MNSIKNSIGASPLHWKFTHILGHQDDYTHFDDLPRLAQLNVLIDNMAKNKLHAMLNRPRWDNNRPQHLPHEHIKIY
jgi:hypothetical protein